MEIAARFAAIAIALVCFSQAGGAQTADENVCYQDSGDRAIEACNRAIASGQVLGDNLAVAHYNRATEYKSKGELARALDDYDQAIHIDRNYTAAYTARGQTLEQINERQRAISDYRTALATAQKYNTGKWAHDHARERLRELGAR